MQKRKLIQRTLTWLSRLWPTSQWPLPSSSGILGTWAQPWCPPGASQKDSESPAGTRWREYIENTIIFFSSQFLFIFVNACPVSCLGFRYDVVVVMFSGQTSSTSDVFPLRIQKAVKLNRLLHQPSVLLDQTVVLTCRVTDGTDIGFLWSFGDGSSRPGNATEHHTYHRWLDLLQFLNMWNTDVLKVLNIVCCVSAKLFSFPMRQLWHKKYDWHKKEPKIIQH